MTLCYENSPLNKKIIKKNIFIDKNLKWVYYCLLVKDNFERRLKIDMDYHILAKELISLMAVKKTPMEDSGQLSRGEIGILMYLRHKQDGISSGDLSKAIDLSTGRVATALKGLERKEYIQRVPDPKDKRRIYVFLLEKGMEYVSEKEQKVLTKTENLLEKLGEEDAKDFVRILKRIMER